LRNYKPGRRDVAGTDAGTDAKFKSLGKTGLGTMGRLYTPKPPPLFVLALVLDLFLILSLFLFRG
jgi:hypothetical protein